jgi:hypothetical protein
MDVLVITPHPFQMTARVPDGMVSLDTDGEWAAWTGVDCATAGAAGAAGTAAAAGMAGGERASVVLVAIAVTPFAPAPGTGAAEALRATLRAKRPAGAVIEELSTADGNPGLRVRSAVTEQRGGRAVTTGQVQAFVAFPGAGALAVVSAVCPDPADIDRAAGLVAGIAARMMVTAATAAA